VKALLRVGTLVKTCDHYAQVHGRPPEKPEAIGKVVDYFRPYGHTSKDKKPPYLVQFLDRDLQNAWYDEGEVERVTRSKSAPSLPPGTSRA
jgi:hypothetical protein